MIRGLGPAKCLRFVACVAIVAAAGLAPPGARSEDGTIAVTLPDPGSFEPPLRGLLEDAVAAVQRNAGNHEPWGNLGMLCHGNLLHAHARQAYAEAARLGPRDPRWHHLLGLLCDQLSLPGEAAAAFSRAIEVNPIDLVAHCTLARIRQERGEDDAARKLFLEAVRLDAKCVAARVGLGQLALRSGVLDMAEKSLQLALEISPRCGPAHAALAGVYASQGRKEEAAFHGQWGRGVSTRIPLPALALEEVQDRAVSYTARLERGQVLASLGRWQEAVERFRAAAALKGDLAEPRYYLGISLIQTGKVDAGLSELEKVTGMEGRKVDAWIRIARARAGRGDITGAHAALGAALKLEPENIEALLERGEVRRLEKKLDLALADFDRAIALEPRNASAHLARGQALLTPGATREEAGRDPAVAQRERQRAKAALSAFTRALELKVDLAEAYEGAGRACMQQWDHAPRGEEKAAFVQAAIVHFRRAVQCFPERKSAHVALIKALYSAGKVEESLAAIARARARWPDDSRFQKDSR